MLLVGAMREVEAHDIHSCLDQIYKNLNAL